ncbi:MAG: alkaline phosphatase [Acidobacteria bacterium]|nr:alkaline phosphatase [Acidobacteriota bacterium]
MLRQISLLLPLVLAPAFGQSLVIDLPERTRLLEDQRVDIVLEVRNATSLSNLLVQANSTNITSQFSTARQADLDCDTTTDNVYRADLVSFPAQANGYVHLVASVLTAQGKLTADRWIRIYPFQLPAQKRNVVLFIGDAMGTAYRDAARLVGRSVEVEPNYGMLREGFFDRLLEMDRMPVSGMVMTYASDRVIPDSANTATAWASGNKTFEAALNVFADGTDCNWRIGGAVSATLPSILDNPRVETLWEYLKRKYNYRTGIVTTAYVEDATPAGQGAHTAQRAARFEVARQYLENPMLANKPVFDVIMGGGKDEFDPDIRLDGRNLLAEFQAA